MSIRNKKANLLDATQINIRQIKYLTKFPQKVREAEETDTSW